MLPLSVVIPSYNGSAYMREALKSIFSQARLPEEIIVVDDGSTDETCSIVETVKQDSPVRLRLHRLPRNSGGPARPINVGVKEASCPLIAILDQDDVFHPDKLEPEANLLLNEPAVSIACSWCARLGTDQSVQSENLKSLVISAARNRPDGSWEFEGRESLRLFIRYGTFLVGYPSFTFRKRDFEALGGVDESLRFASDLDFLGKLAQRGETVLLPHIGYCRRYHAGNATNNGVDSQLEAARVRVRLLRGSAELSRDAQLTAELSEFLYGLGYWFRESGDDGPAFQVYRLMTHLPGRTPQAAGAILKLGIHRLLRRLGLRRVIFSPYNRVA